MLRNALISFTCLMLLSGCANAVAGLGEYIVPLYSPEYASGFRILGAEGKLSTVIVVSNPWQGASDVENMLFVRRGSESIPEGFAGQVIEGDACRVICMSSSHVAMLDAVGAAETVAGVSGLRFVCNPVVRSSGAYDIGYDENIDYERILSLMPDIVLLYGVNGSSPAQNKLDELGVPYLYIGEYVEQTPLGKAEWMVAVAETVGRRETAQEVFRGIATRYNELKAGVPESGRIPLVMLNTPYNDIWYMPSLKSYMVRLLEDAGGAYVYRENDSGSSCPVDMEDALRLLSKADVWLNAQAASVNELCRDYPALRDVPSLVSGRVYNCDRRTSEGRGNDFWETGVVEPDVVLRDLIGILHPELSLNDKPVYYRQL